MALCVYWWTINPRPQPPCIQDFKPCSCPVKITRTTIAVIWFLSLLFKHLRHPRDSQSLKASNRTLKPKTFHFDHSDTTLPNYSILHQSKSASMHLFTITAFGSLGIFILPAFALHAADPATPSFIIDPAAVTAAPAVPDSGKHVASDAATDAATEADATGQATVLNNCAFLVYLYACSQTPATCTAESTLAAQGGTYAETFSDPSTGGRSIKIGTTSGEVSKPILQFEYTNADSGQVSYDLSEVNGNPFGPYGFALTSNNAACFQQECPAPGTANVCPFVFTTSTDGTVSNCPATSSIGVTLCG